MARTKQTARKGFATKVPMGAGGLFQRANLFARQRK